MQVGIDGLLPSCWACPAAHSAVVADMTDASQQSTGAAAECLA